MVIHWGLAETLGTKWVAIISFIFYEGKPINYGKIHCYGGLVREDPSLERPNISGRRSIFFHSPRLIKDVNHPSPPLPVFCFGCSPLRWFRNDLRLHDNPLLHAGVVKASEVSLPNRQGWKERNWENVRGKKDQQKIPPGTGHKLFPRVWLHTKCCWKISAIQHFLGWGIEKSTAKGWPKVQKSFRK